jgi:hypothetical protein
MGHFILVPLVIIKLKELGQKFIDAIIFFIKGDIYKNAIDIHQLTKQYYL